MIRVPRALKDAIVLIILSDELARIVGSLLCICYVVIAEGASQIP